MRCVNSAAVPRSPFYQQVRHNWQAQQTLLCVGLDPNPEKIPQGVTLAEFCREIVAATHDLVCAFKPQIAYFSATAQEQTLEELIDYIHLDYPDIPVILDAKRGDVGSTAKLYAQECFERYAADAVTVNPYLGVESIKPFTDYHDRGVFVLARTSNPNSQWLQHHPKEDPVYMRVAVESNVWNTHNNVGLVAGATYPEELKKIRAAIGDMPMLVPGVGAQGGSLEEVLAVGLDSNRQGLIINASRSILYANADRHNFADAARRAALDLVREMREITGSR